MERKRIAQSWSEADDVDTIGTYYEVLGIPKTATHAEIREAYKKVAMRFHPDKNVGDDDASRFFNEACRAYEVLSDDSARQRYDANGFKTDEELDPRSQWSDPGVCSYPARRRTQAAKGPSQFKKDAGVETMPREDYCLTAAEYANGATVEVSRTGLWNACECPSRSTNCPACRGSGTVPNVTRTAVLTIPPSPDSTLRKKCDLSVAFESSTRIANPMLTFACSVQDTFFIQGQPGETLEASRNGDDIVATKYISPEEMLLGTVFRFSYPFPVAEGDPSPLPIEDDWLTVSSPPGEVIKDGEKMRLEGFGFLRQSNRCFGERGDIIFEFRVRFPDHGVLSATDRQRIASKLRGNDMSAPSMDDRSIVRLERIGKAACRLQGAIQVRPDDHYQNNGGGSVSAKDRWKGIVRGEEDEDGDPSIDGDAGEPPNCKTS